ncbi:hypothetical protein V2G26_010033 [Clonostachys chloroleuca]
MHCVHSAIKNTMINVTTSGIEHCVSRLNHESSGAIRKYEMSIDDLTSPEPMTNSVCADMDALRPKVACDGVRSQTWMFHPYNSVARITVTVTPTPMTFSLSSVRLDSRPLQETRGGE